VSELAGIETVMLLQSVDLFAHCRAEEILRIAAIASERHFGSGERIYEVNGPADVLYCVIRGEVILEVPDAARREVTALGTFGVEEILSGRLRTSSAIASQKTLALAIEADDLFDLLAHNINIVRALFRHLLESPDAVPRT
jgi:CRP-like cAMP-binding protein